jgi:GNAT superfamily N-acetyltransferase
MTRRASNASRRDEKKLAGGSTAGYPKTKTRAPWKGAGSGIDCTIIEADLSRTEHQATTLQLLDAYAQDAMGNGQALTESVKREVIPGLREHPTTIVFLAYRDALPIGLAICFRGFSTFAARPLVNIHDFYVVPAHRGEGIADSLLKAIEQRARQLGCCRLTLEVQEHNHRAKRIYAAAGFNQMMYVSDAGGSLFLSKSLQ